MQNEKRLYGPAPSAAAPGAPPRGDGNDIANTALRRSAPDAAGELAEAMDMAGTGAMAIGTAAQGAMVSEAAAEPVTDERREVARSVFRLAWPAIAENALQSLMGIVDTAVVARLGTAALSGVGVSQQLIFVLTTSLIAISMGTTVLVARTVGAGNKHESSAALKQSTIMAVLLGLVLTPVMFLSGPLLSLFGMEPLATDAGAIYLTISMGFAVPIVVMLVLGAALRGAGDTRTPMMVTGFINVVNAILAVELVFGGNKASGILSGWLSGLASMIVPGAHITVPGLDWIPELGVAGSAWATALARTLGMLILMGVYFLPRSPLKLWTRGGWRPNFGIMGRVLRIGIPSAVEQMLMSLGIMIYSFLVVGMGEVIFATSRLALNAVFLSQMPAFGFAVAATTLVGQSLGARKADRAILGANLSARSALIWMSAMGLVFFFFGEHILKIFTDDPRLLSLGGDALKVIAFNQPFLALAFVLGGALRGAGDVRYPMVVTTIAVWFVRLPVGAFLGLPSIFGIPGLGLGLQGIYGALIVEASFRAVLLYRRFRAGHWQTIRV